MSEENSQSNEINLDDIEPKSRFFASGMALYLRHKGLRCIQVDKLKDKIIEAPERKVRFESYEVDHYYVMKPEKCSEIEKSKVYLPDFKDILNHEIKFFFINLEDNFTKNPTYVIEIKTVDNDILKTKRKYIDNYDNLICLRYNLPTQESKKETITVSNKVQVELTDPLAPDPFMKGIPIDRDQFYNLVDKIAKLKEQTSAESKNLDDDENDDLICMEFKEFEEKHGLNAEKVRKYGTILKIENLYLDITEVDRWVHVKK